MEDGLSKHRQTWPMLVTGWMQLAGTQISHLDETRRSRGCLSLSRARDAKEWFEGGIGKCGSGLTFSGSEGGFGGSAYPCMTSGPHLHACIVCQSPASTNTKVKDTFTT